MADKALLLGINDYARISDLRGCKNDVATVAQLLSELYGFPNANMRTHLNHEVTKATVRDGFQWLSEGANAGDRLVFHFSGHGSYTESSDEDEQIDELICLYDMDIDNPDTYLLDDELGRFTAQLPVGVHLTVILDTCYSGTGTRKVVAAGRNGKAPRLIMQDTMHQLAGAAYTGVAQQRNAGDTTLLPTLPVAPEASVYARVYERPARLQERKQRSLVHKFGQCLSNVTRSTGINHQLLAAASDEQTAADAFIQGDFYGAFTYYLCETVRQLGANATAAQVMEKTKVALQAAAFTQTPQIEGVGLDAPLFVREAVVPAVVPAVELPVSTTVGIVQEEQAMGSALLAQMWRVSERLLDLNGDRFSEGGIPSMQPPFSRAATEVVLYVHGINRHPAGYSRAWWQAMQPHLDDRTIARREVLWSPVVNPRLLDRSAELPAEAQAFIANVEMLLEDRHRQLLAKAPVETRRAASTERALTQSREFDVDDFARYMYVEREREAILSIFDRALRPLLQAGTTVHVISHSWGSVVAWEGLRRLDRVALPGRVANLFVVGSALALGPARLNLFRRITDGRRPALVQQIYNLDAAGDVVGGSIQDDFDINREFLELDPVGCAKIPFTNIAHNPGCAHGSYFKKENRYVNRDIFAKLIND